MLVHINIVVDTLAYSFMNKISQHFRTLKKNPRYSLKE